MGLTSCNEAPPQSNLLDQIKIVRDQWGVPHIFASTNKEVAYGLAWVQCEDDFNTMQEQMLAIKGMLGEVKGQDGIVVDFGVKFMGLREIVEERYETDLAADFSGSAAIFCEWSKYLCCFASQRSLVEGDVSIEGARFDYGLPLGHDRCLWHR